MNRKVLPLFAAIALGLAVFLWGTVLRAPEDRTDDRPLASRYTEPTAHIDMILVQPRGFVMGTPPTEADREVQEVQHFVNLTRAFYIGVYEVTQQQWAAVMGGNPSNFAGCGLCPVERVSYYDVQSFIRQLNVRGESGFRLPTEAEWEASCRAGGTQTFGNRSTLGGDDANIDSAYPYGTAASEPRGRTVPVGQFPPNAWGLFDMSGNVWEWVEDWHCPYPAGPVSDPVGQCTTDYRVIRGGSWKFNGSSARCGLRYTHRPQDSGYSLGFRLARDAR
jgi:formylglycine-generating enzyme required for sulfatase activity